MFLTVQATISLSWNMDCFCFWHFSFSCSLQLAGWAPSVPDQDRVVRTKLINLIWSLKTSSTSATHGETREHPSDKSSDASHSQASSVKIRTPTPGVWWLEGLEGLSSKYLSDLTPHTPSLPHSQWSLTWSWCFIPRGWLKDNAIWRISFSSSVDWIPL